MIPGLERGRWSRPSDTMAVYVELDHPDAWGVRVTLMPQAAQVEAIQGEKCSRYKAPRHLSAYVYPPTFWERLRGITFEAKLLEEVERKRQVAAAENRKARSLQQGEALQPGPALQAVPARRASS